MKIIRQITYTFINRETLDRQMGRSRPDGNLIITRQGDEIGRVHVETFLDERRIVECFTPDMVEN